MAGTDTAETPVIAMMVSEPVVKGMAVIRTVTILMAIHNHPFAVVVSILLSSCIIKLAGDGGQV